MVVRVCVASDGMLCRRVDREFVQECMCIAGDTAKRNEQAQYPEKCATDHSATCRP